MWKATEKLNQDFEELLVAADFLEERRQPFTPFLLRDLARVFETRLGQSDHLADFQTKRLARLLKGSDAAQRKRFYEAYYPRYPQFTDIDESIKNLGSNAFPYAEKTLKELKTHLKRMIDSVAGEIFHSGLVTLVQIVDAAELESRTRELENKRIGVANALVELGYVSTTDVGQARAKVLGLEFVDSIKVSSRAFDLSQNILPESVARENRMVGFVGQNNEWNIFVKDVDSEIIDKLKFVLARNELNIRISTIEVINIANNEIYGTEHTVEVTLPADLTNASVDDVAQMSVPQNEVDDALPRHQFEEPDTPPTSMPSHRIEVEMPSEVQLSKLRRLFRRVEPDEETN